MHESVAINPSFVSPAPLEPFHTPALRRAAERLADPSGLMWWRLPAPAPRDRVFADLIEDPPVGVAWHTAEQTARLLGLMSAVNRAKVEDAARCGRRRVGAVYRRTRRDGAGARIQRAEVRFDDVSGCLRTPAGGSSRQLILVVEGPAVRSRLTSARESARLMGLADAYVLPANYNQAYRLTGDGVVVDVVRHLARRLIEPLLKARTIRAAA